MGVDLGRAQIFVPENVFKHPNVGAALLIHQRSSRMAQFMRRHRLCTFHLAQMLFNDVMNALQGYPLLSRTQEQGIFIARSVNRTHLQIGLQRIPASIV